MSFKLILFDADETLFDFAQSEIVAFKNTIQPYLGHLPFEKVFERYKKVSRKLWSRVEKGKVNNNYLKVERFRRLKRLFKFKYDAKTISEKYLEQLSQQSILLPGALELCRELHENYRLGIVTNGIAMVQHRRLQNSPINEFIDFMVVSEECGFAKPDPRIFKYTLEKAMHSKLDSVLMVGDRLEADIAGAEAAGISSCWYNPNRRARGSYGPTFEIQNLSELVQHLENKKSSQFWEENAQNWNRAIESGSILSRATTGPAIVKEILKRSPKSVLDVGCGEGWLCAPLLEEDINYLGIDGSQGLINIAKLQQAGSFEKVSYAEIIQIPWRPPAPVDVIVFNFSLLDSDTLPLLKQVGKYLKDVLIIQTLSPRFTEKDNWQIEDFKAMKTSFEGTMPWFSRTLSSWIELFKLAGFELEETIEPVLNGRPASMIFILKLARP